MDHILYLCIRHYTSLGHQDRNIESFCTPALLCTIHNGLVLGRHENDVDLTIFPHEPQFEESLVKSTQLPLQEFRPSGHWHSLFEHRP